MAWEYQLEVGLRRFDQGDPSSTAGVTTISGGAGVSRLFGDRWAESEMPMTRSPSEGERADSLLDSFRTSFLDVFLEKLVMRFSGGLG